MALEEVGFPIDTMRGRPGCDAGRYLSKLELTGWEMFLFGRKIRDRT